MSDVRSLGYLAALLFADVECPQTSFGGLECNDPGCSSKVVEHWEQGAERQIAQVREQEAQELSRLDKLIAAARELAQEVKEKAVEVAQNVSERMEQLRGRFERWRDAVELQKQAATAVKNLEGERVRLQGVGPTLQQNAAWAMRESIREHSDKIETQISAGLAVPLDQIKQAAAQVRQNISEISLLVRCLIFATGIVVGLALGWLPYRSSLNHLQEQQDRIEQYLAAQQQPAPAAPEPAHAPAHKGKK